MSLNMNALYEQMSKQPHVRKAVHQRAEKLRDYMEMRWPKVNRVSDNQRSRLREAPEHTILISDFNSSVDGRPMSVVTVRHPGAIERQARTGFVTRAVKDVS
ncbi:hypothetical protein [Corynebacterium sp. HMSC08A12]|uniref:hypothetical protein n=1 Tax=Corynebacterium sp. HMSC08A12 TaxID=1581134 RepID=UPI00143BAC9E|nr:hypothetical protein [Corynebacterium sp. HMSC08A12]